MKLSAKMPATMDSTLPASMPSTMPSDTQQTGDGGKRIASAGPISQKTPKSVMWECINDNKPGWEIGSDEQKGPSWELTDRKDENDENAMPQESTD